ncbi:MAG: hypothetical protein QM765_26350 [Myxococcales bacterium]
MPLNRLGLIVAGAVLTSLPALAQPRTLSDAVELQAQALAPGAAKVGDVFQGQGKRGDDADWNVSLQPGCYLVSGAGGPGVERLYLSFFNGKERLAKVASKTPLASIAQCVPAAGTYRVRATIDEGKGAFAVGLYSQPAAAAPMELDRLVDAFAAAQVPQLTRAPDRFPLLAGVREQEWLAPVRDGVCATFVAIADGTAKDLSLALFHPNGKEQARTRDAAQAVVLEHCARQNGTLILKAKLGAAGAASLARYDSQPAAGLQGIALAADRLGRAHGATAEAAAVLVARAKDGEECDWRLPLEAGCYLFSLMRGEGVEKVEASVTDPARQRVKVTDSKPAAICAKEPGLYKVRAVIADGGGEVALAAHRVESASVAEAKPEALCDAHAAAVAPAGNRAETWSIPAGKRPEWVVSLQAGTCYSFVGAGTGIKELRLELRSATNKEQAKSREDRDRAVVDFCPKDAGSYRLVAHVEGKGSAAVVRYERAAPAAPPPAQAVAPAEPARFQQPANVNVTVTGVNMPQMPVMPQMPGMPAMPTHNVGVQQAGMHQAGTQGTASSSGTCCVNGRFYECSASGMASCADVAACMSDVARDAMNSKSGSMDSFASRADGCARKLDTFACTAQPSRNGECK